MHLEVKSGERTAKIEILEQIGSYYKVRIDNKEYDLDVEKVSEGIYSVIHNGQSTNLEMIEGETINAYKVNTLSNYYEIEVIDARTRYLAGSKGDQQGGDNVVTSPMPGKVVRIPVAEGQKVEKGQTVIVISAMKMESEYKAPVNGTVHHILVKEGATVEGHQPLIEIRAEE
ncbi:MAG: biotin/lipoyl-binding protein [Breznakibacter sp.]